MLPEIGVATLFLIRCGYTPLKVRRTNCTGALQAAERQPFYFMARCNKLQRQRIHKAKHQTEQSNCNADETCLCRYHKTLLAINAAPTLCLRQENCTAGITNSIGYEPDAKRTLANPPLGTAPACRWRLAEPHRSCRKRGTSGSLAAAAGGGSQSAAMRASCAARWA